jgi:hypothetical protein
MKKLIQRSLRAYCHLKKNGRTICLFSSYGISGSITSSIPDTACPKKWRIRMKRIVITDVDSQVWSGNSHSLYSVQFLTESEIAYANPEKRIISRQVGLTLNIFI